MQLPGEHKNKYNFSLCTVRRHMVEKRYDLNSAKDGDWSTLRPGRLAR